jgi:thiamine-monophosphate kinase
VLAGGPALLSTVLNGGDDYEILATVPARRAGDYAAAAATAGVPVARIGEILRGEGPPVVLDEAGRSIALSAPSHTHF